MKATYKVSKTPSHLVKMGTDPFTITYMVGNFPDWDYERKVRKHFYKTEVAAHEAGKRYLRKMKKNGFTV